MLCTASCVLYVVSVVSVAFCHISAGLTRIRMPCWRVHRSRGTHSSQDTTGTRLSVGWSVLHCLPASRGLVHCFPASRGLVRRVMVVPWVLPPSQVAFALVVPMHHAAVLLCRCCLTVLCHRAAHFVLIIAAWCKTFPSHTQTHRPLPRSFLQWQGQRTPATWLQSLLPCLPPCLPVLQQALHSGMLSVARHLPRLVASRTCMKV